MPLRRAGTAARKDIKRFGAAVADEVKFIANWARKPMTTGAISPSGRSLARKMASLVDPSWPGVVVELGPGTGAVTAALLARGVEPSRLVTVEYNPTFAAHLSERYPDIHVVTGDAYALKDTLAKAGVGEVAAVVSSLPLFTRPAHERRALVDQVLSMIPAGRPLIQFSYALVPPVAADPVHFSLDVSDWILMNLPPARVWTYRRSS